MSQIKTRFCPSPTGLMHIGNLRTALFSALLAQSSEQGSFLVRIEDTDQARSKLEFTEQLLADLLWLGVSWNEGPGKEQDNGPYFQSKRNDIYEQYYQQLLDEGHAFWCFCSEAELSVQRKAQLRAGQPPRYPGTCRHLTNEQIDKKRAQGIEPALRLRVPDEITIRFDDFIQGPKVFKSEDIGDFIIKKADGTASFMFCNAVDDALMGVTHAMRGDDHITNTPRQLYILQLLGLKAPQYGHTAIILGMDGKPLSKVQAYAAKNFEFRLEKTKQNSYQRPKRKLDAEQIEANIRWHKRRADAWSKNPDKQHLVKGERQQIMHLEQQLQETL